MSNLIPLYKSCKHSRKAMKRKLARDSPDTSPVSQVANKMSRLLQESASSEPITRFKLASGDEEMEEVFNTASNTYSSAKTRTITD